MSKIEKNKDQVLEDYLQGKSGISRQYQVEANKQQPAKYLDDAILAAARKSAGARPRGIHTIFNSNWYKPVSWAAVLVICVSVVFNIYQDSDQELLTTPASAPSLKQSPEMRSDNGIEPVTKSNESTLSDILSDTEQKSVEINAAKPEDIKMIWQQDTKQPEGFASPQPQPTEPVTTDRERENKVLRKEVFNELTELKDETTTSDVDDLSVSTEEDSILEKMKIQSRDAGAVKQEMKADIEFEDLPPEQWLEQINFLWERGNRKTAKESLRRFLVSHPGYPHTRIRDILSPEINLSDFID